ncbi:MAG: glycerophosphodiester phosphodiesterase [Actinomycetes bacterium]
MNSSKLVRVGHKGAHAMHQGNTLESFDAALATGVDMIEFDVLPSSPRDPHSELVLAHDLHDLSARTPVTLAAALAHLSSPKFDGIEFDVDLKIPGYEARVGHALIESGMASRSLVSSQYERSLEAIKRTAPTVRVGWSVPKASRDWTKNPLTFLPALGMVMWLRRTLPGEASDRVRRGVIDCVMAHWCVATEALNDAVREAGGELFVWTVDDASRMQEMARIGVAGIISNDPRLFKTALAPA